MCSEARRVVTVDQLVLIVISPMAIVPSEVQPEQAVSGIDISNCCIKTCVELSWVLFIHFTHEDAGCKLLKQSPEIFTAT